MSTHEEFVGYLVWSREAGDWRRRPCGEPIVVVGLPLGSARWIDDHFVLPVFELVENDGGGGRPQGMIALRDGSLQEPVFAGGDGDWRATVVSGKCSIVGRGATKPEATADLQRLLDRLYQRLDSYRPEAARK